MTQENREETFVKFKTDDVVHTADTLIALSGQVTAIHEEYTKTGSLAVGALLHVSSTLDQVIKLLGLDEIAVEQQSLPF